MLAWDLACVNLVFHTLLLLSGAFKAQSERCIHVCCITGQRFVLLKAYFPKPLEQKLICFRIDRFSDFQVELVLKEQFDIFDICLFAVKRSVFDAYGEERQKEMFQGKWPLELHPNITRSVHQYFFFFLSLLLSPMLYTVQTHKTSRNVDAFLPTITPVKDLWR